MASLVCSGIRIRQYETWGNTTGSHHSSMDASFEQSAPSSSLEESAPYKWTQPLSQARICGEAAATGQAFDSRLFPIQYHSRFDHKRALKRYVKSRGRQQLVSERSLLSHLLTRVHHQGVAPRSPRSPRPTWESFQTRFYGSCVGLLHPSR